ncbi:MULTISPECIES: helix-turn-helix transcriptional regulator [Campylobacter]|uniref:helix-turn-helix transcriptional regulator n=1 Tax=Campylobacter TaxID=194 RepID=UPI000874045B|nr:MULTISPECIES: helix-turn-helix domain-containing protein [Campylobacter]OEW16796.1 DNA-binding protein [Campylobacter sp. BCW_6877]OEW32584.1 DNA-binding protein [Campylobacter jejuni]OEW79193.1 DNA-binding protein [Campylobacter sp. BCW_4333]OIN31819.1 DNA-binding protein [Campylobacter jejuni]
MVKKYFREKELSEYLGVSITSLFRLRQDGKIPYIRIGKSIRYEIKEIENGLKLKDIKSKTHKENLSNFHTIA